MTRSIRHIIMLIIAASVSLGGFSGEPGKKIVILHTNDMHSRLEGFAPSLNYTPNTVNDDNTVGGFSRLATVIERERSKDPEHTLVVDAGDFLMGTLFHFMEEYNGFQLPLMSSMGYEVTAIGNHEFDYGPERLAKIISQSRLKGKIPGLLLSNALFDDEDTADDGLEALLDDGTISRSIIVEKDGLKIGFFSLMGIDADDVAPFAPPVKFSGQVKTARKMARELKKQGCDVVICLSHSGVSKDKKGEWAGEDVKLARKVKGLDAIISAHTHTRLTEPLMVKGVPVVQAGSYARYLGRLELETVPGGVKVAGYSLIPVDDETAGNAEVQAMILEQKELISAELLEPLGYNMNDVIIRNSFEVVCDEYGGDLENSNLGPMVADAIQAYVNRHYTSGTDISMVAAGVIRDNLVPGDLTVQDIFRVMSLGSGKDPVPGYPLAQVYVTGIELKRIVEILLVAYKSSPSNYCYYSGLKVMYDPSKGLLRKVKSIELVGSDGTLEAVDLSKDNSRLYSITANAYMLEFVGIIKKTTFGLVNVIPKDAQGNAIEDMKTAILDFDSAMPGVQEGKEWIALTEFLTAMQPEAGGDYPSMDKFYLKPPLRVIPVN